MPGPCGVAQVTFLPVMAGGFGRKCPDTNPDETGFSYGRTWIDRHSHLNRQPMVDPVVRPSLAVGAGFAY